MKRLFMGTLGAILFLILSVLGVRLYSAGQGGTINRVSVASDGTEGDGQSYYAAISADGQRVVFDSDATTLVLNDSNGQRDIFVHDRPTHQTVLVSLATDGTPSNGFSEFAILSGDGQIVVYHSDATNLVPDDTNGVRDVFAYDLATGITTRLSVATDGIEGNGASSRPVVSADGRIVAFYSDASNLVSNDTNGATDVFVHDRITGTTTRLSVAPDGTQGNGNSFNPSISDDGTLVVFGSEATNMVVDDTNTVSDVFLHNRSTGETTRLSVVAGVQGNGDSRIPILSGDGGTVTFISEATNLVSGDNNQVADIFVYDRASDTLTRVSVATDGTEGNGDSLKPTISQNGRIIAFYSFASNLVADDTNDATDIFVHDRANGITTRISISSSGVQGDRYSFDPAISADGHIIAFNSDSTTFVSGDTNNLYDIFVYERFHRFFLPMVE